MQTQLREDSHLLSEVALESNLRDRLGLDPCHLPLEEYRIYRGEDFDSAAAAVSSVSGPRTFEILSPDEHPFIELRRARLRHSEVGLTFNTVETRLSTTERTNYYSLAILLSGSQVSRTDDGEVITQAPDARLHSAGSVYDIRRSSDYMAVILSLSLSGFEHFVGDRINYLVPPDGAFSLKLDISEERFELFTSILRSLLKALDERGKDAPQGDIVIARLEEALWFAFADACPELYSEYRHLAEPDESPRFIKRVIAYIHDNAQRDLTLSDLVEVSGRSARTLYSGFSHTYGIGPMAYLKRVRLNRCREDLLAAGPHSCLVGDVAANWGFYHLSSFAQSYRKEFGELPSETLKIAN